MKQSKTVPPNPHQLAFFGAVVAAILWATTGIFIELLRPVNIVWIIWWRCLLAAMLSLVWIGSRRRLRLTSASLRQSAFLVLSLYMGGYYFVAVLAFRYASVAEVGLILNASPAVALLIQLFRREPLHRAQVQGCLIAMLGLVLIFAPQLLSMGGGSSLRIVGLSLAIVGCVLMALFSRAYTRSVQRGYVPDGDSVALGAFVVGLLLSSMMPARGFEGVVLPHAATLWFYLVGLALLGTVAPTILYANAARQLPPVVSTATRLVTPIVMTVAAIYIVDQHPEPLFWVGGACVLLGLVRLMVGSTATA